MDWPVYGVIAGFLAAWGGMLLWAVKIMLDRQARHIDDRFAELTSERRKESTRLSDLERELLTFKADLPTLYVRREDAIRNETAFHHKLDALALRIESLRELITQ